MHRSFELARLSTNKVKTNPNVGCVIVHENRIIGEGYHEYFGGPHAERNAFNSVEDKDKRLIPESTLFVSLEPCNIHSKTPPCADLILKHELKQVVVSTTDPNPLISGKSIHFLRENGINVRDNILSEDGKKLIGPFISNLKKLPYVIIKFAQSIDSYIGKQDSRVLISHPYTNKFVHKWRSEIDGILIGYNTALIDNPKLTTRLYPGTNPTRIVLDKHLSLPRTHRLWSDEHLTIFIADKGHSTEVGSETKRIVTLDFNSDEFIEQLLQTLYSLGICRLMVEGGSKTLKKFIDSGLWNEARIIHSPIQLNSGIRAPYIFNPVEDEEIIMNDRITYHFNNL